MARALTVTVQFNECVSPLPLPTRTRHTPQAFTLALQGRIYRQPVPDCHQHPESRHRPAGEPFPPSLCSAPRKLYAKPLTTPLNVKWGMTWLDSRLCLSSALCGAIVQALDLDPQQGLDHDGLGFF